MSKPRTIRTNGKNYYHSRNDIKPIDNANDPTPDVAPPTDVAPPLADSDPGTMGSLGDPEE